MANENCLEGMSCPKCGSEEPFNISIRTVMEVWDNGTEGNEDTEWDDKDYCRCGRCKYEGKVRDFTISYREMKKLKRTKDHNLPKFIGKFESDEAQQELERRLAHGKVQPTAQGSGDSPQAPLP